MTNDCLLIQHVSENNPVINLLKVTAVRNLEYCILHKMDFDMRICGETPVDGHWDAIRLVRGAMDKDYKYIVYLDADTVIVDMKADLRDGCPEGKIGACRHVLTKETYNIDLDHLNVGAVYYSVNDETKAFVDKWLAEYPGTKEPPWHEQGAMNKINDGTVVEIDAKWNATGNVNPSPNPVVLGFHGQANGSLIGRFNLMLKAIGK